MPQLETISSFALQGLSCRTSNAAEMDRQNPERGRIAPLWQAFAAAGLHGDVHGAYFNYADRHHGEYSVLAGVKASSGQGTAAASASSVQVPGGLYLVFEAQGPLPEALIRAWGEVWAYFEQAEAPQRAYGVDFERYLGPSHAQICIGLAA
ncbi:GyrI-like domain-containing protein [Paucibacter sp. DJ1R-11]|uniref:GyrI-like domain-containing protein n=1 Tax=Paucibacter sp. DJ1R-11 TaxID=2893556 RepID=UPI0021E403A6|nr:GyrI-like domain-containing protein [Paucibacter sp. DJ1R-11]MCV2363177.1 GyrI-like domain-containing protein [Paucibacter sp. DJ1R-11]